MPDCDEIRVLRRILRKALQTPSDQSLRPRKKPAFPAGTLLAAGFGMMTIEPKPVALFGAAPDTGNLGVTALSQSVIAGLWTRSIRSAVVFDHGRGSRPQERRIGADRVLYSAQGAVGGMRLYRPENLHLAIAQSRLGISWSPIVRTIRESSAVLDISGGDSFSDIYGKRRFTSIVQPKQLAMENGTPLVLLPQTYGPFEDGARRAEACDIVRGAALVFARDRRSHALLVDMLGDRYNPARHLCGVDVAFALPVTEPAPARRDPFLSWKRRQAGRIAGVNVSGLLFNEPGQARRRFGLGTDFSSLCLAFTRRLLEETEAGVMLLPHVLDRPGSRESDEDAVRSVHAELAPRFGGRIFVPQMPDCASEAKWFISQCDWFTGARMHATIGALSSGVPALALAYSGKMQGVFESCGQGASVADLRGEVSEASLLERMLASFEDAGHTRKRLAAQLPGTLSQAAFQLDYVAAFLKKGAAISPDNTGARHAA
jgi:polysaccharide pyruvyl transferase WcaK-like protein